jgi:hypothetical protein
VGQERAVFPAHKLILAARSDYFRKMFYGVQMREAKESTCSFPDDDPTVFKTMLYHLYERPLEFVLDPRHIALCLVTSEKYSIDTFKSFCLKTLEEQLSISTACEIASIMEELSDTPLGTFTRNLAERCDAYLLSHLTEIINTEAHFSLSSPLLERILQYPFLGSSEISLFKAVTSWHLHHFESFQTQRNLLMHNLSFVDLRSIELRDVATVVHPSGVFNAREMAELYRTRIQLQHFGRSARLRRRCALMFHAGAEYASRPLDVLKSLKEAGLVIDTADVLNFTESPAENVQRLMEYSVILVFSMETRSKGCCGDLLAEYVERGGCIVLCHALGCIDGKIVTENFLPVKREPPLEGEFKQYQLGKVLVSKHPLFEGVRSLKVRCGPNFVWNCTVQPGAKVLAEWHDGTVLACERFVGSGRILFLNLYPVSTRVVVVGLDKEGDGHILLRNALLYTAYRPTAW